MSVIVLNADYTFLNVVDVRKAIGLMFTGKVEVVENSEKVISSISRDIIIPKVVRLVNLVKSIYHRKVKFTKKNIFIRDKYICGYCGQKISDKRKLSIDHIVPKCRGGKDTWNNCITSCLSCNNKKGNKTLTESGMRLLYEPYEPNISRFIQLKFKNLELDNLFETILF